jgi:DNA helicase HerA-like ATPase
MTGRADGSTAWRGLSSVPACRITDIPRPDGGGHAPAAAHAQRAAALTAAWHAAAAGGQAGVLAVGWVRWAEGSPVHLLAAGNLLPGGHAEGEVMLALPAGARGQLLPPGAVPRLLAELPCWQPVGGISDGLLTDGVPDSRAAPGLALEECLLPAWTGPFGWLVVAEPLAPAAIAEMASEAGHAGHVDSLTSDRHPQRAPRARRLQLRHGELQRGLSAGMWRLRIAAGAATPHAAAVVAGLACCSPGLAGLPYLIAPAREPAAGISQLLSAPPALGQAGGNSVTGFPFDGSTELLAALTCPPAAEVPGVRLTLRPAFDITPEHTTASPAGPGTAISAGQVLDHSLMPAGPLTLPLDSLNRHVFVCGATGSGKSQTVRALLEAATAAGIPWLVIEPAKAEYRLMAARLAPSGTEVIRIRPGEADGIPAGINPLEPAPGPAGTRFPLQTHAGLIRALFLATFRSEEPFPQVLSAALTRVYEETGWDLALGEPAHGHGDPGYPGLAALQRAAEQVVTEIGYSQRVTDDVLGFIRVRLASLRHGTTGRFLDGGHQLDFARLLQRNVVLEIEDVGDDQDKAFLMGTVLIRLTEHLRITHRAAPRSGAGLAHLTVVEEAHRLLRRTSSAAGAAAQATEMFAALLAEIRAYGEGLIIAEQIPARLIPDVIKNTAIKITHRLPAADDRDAVGATMNMTEAQSRYLITLPPGQAAVSTDGMDHPVLAQMPDGTARETAPAPAAAPGQVVRPRSVTCGSNCAARPCTLRDMRAAQRTLTNEPVLTLLAELAVLAHLTGWAMPVPREPVLRKLQAMPSRLRECAIAHATDTAVATRVPAIASRLSPPALASHVTTAITTRVEHGQWLCAAEEPQWLAPAYQWALVLDALEGTCRASPAAGRHPRSSEWEQAHGRVIPGSTSARQADAVRAWHDSCQHDPAALDAVAFGDASPSAIEQAAGARRDDPEFGQHLTAQLSQFTNCEWPLFFLDIAAREAGRHRTQTRST